MAATLTTHVLDTARGTPGAGIEVRLYALDGDDRRLVTATRTDAGGRTGAPLATELAAGTYELVFDVAPYFARHGMTSFFEAIPVRFVLDGGERYHVPLLLSPWGYSSYRGS